MPIYAYRCTNCGHAQDVLQKISDPLLTVCPACGAATFVKQVTAAGFQLKGSGWYVTDFRGDNKAGQAGDAGDGDERPARPARRGRRPKPSGGGRSRGERAESADAAKKRRRRRPRPPPAPAAAPAPARAERDAPGSAALIAAAASEEVPDRRPAGLAAARRHDLGAAGRARPARRRVRLAARRLAGGAARGQPRVHRDAAARSPVLGVIVMLIGLLLTGVFATNVVGQWSLRQGHRLLNAHPDRQVDLQLGEAGLRHAVLEQRQRLSRGGAGAVPARGLLDDRLRHRQAGRRGGAAPARRLPQRLRADDAEPDLGLFPDAAARRRDRAGDERRRGAEVRDLDGRRRAAARGSTRAPLAAAKSAGLSARPALSPSPRTRSRSAVPHRRALSDGASRPRQECME